MGSLSAYASINLTFISNFKFLNYNLQIWKQHLQQAVFIQVQDKFNLNHLHEKLKHVNLLTKILINPNQKRVVSFCTKLQNHHPRTILADHIMSSSSSRLDDEPATIIIYVRFVFQPSNHLKNVKGNWKTISKTKLIWWYDYKDVTILTY